MVYGRNDDYVKCLKYGYKNVKFEIVKKEKEKMEGRDYRGKSVIVCTHLCVRKVIL